MNSILKPKKAISLDCVILFLLAFSILYFLFGATAIVSLLPFWILGFLLLFIYLFLDLKLRNNKNLHIYKLLIIIFLTVLISLTQITNEIYLRHNASPCLYTHDGALQMEEAAKYLLHGENPYTRDYFGTPLEELWGGKVNIVLEEGLENPALYHFIMLPWHLFFSIPFYLISMLAFGWYDQRVIYILLFALSLLIAYKIPKKKSDKLLYLIIFAFNPIFVSHFSGGTNDIFVFFWVIWSIYLLKINKISWSALVLGLAVASKHSAWFIVPFYFLYLFLKQKEIFFLDKCKLVLKQTKWFWIAVVLLFGFFIIWDFGAFFEDIYKYPAGALATSYPINGMGFSVFLVAAGFIKSCRDYFPFIIIQLMAGIPLFYFLVKAQIKNNNLSQVMFNYGLFLFVFLFFSRFFHGNYIAYLSLIFMSAYFLGEES
ncbi:MAG: hypothetical protein ABIJ83_02715 [Patescibacteria group bacterium]